MAYDEPDRESDWTEELPRVGPTGRHQPWPASSTWEPDAWFYRHDDPQTGPHPTTAPGAARPHRARAGAAIIAAALILASGGVGAALGTALNGRTGRGTAAPDLPVVGGGGTTPTTAAPLAGIDPAAAAAKVDPAVVDINTTLSGGGQAAGTGMVLTASGLVLTNNHVIDGAESISVQDANGRTYSGRALGYDVADDVAVVQLDGASGLKTAPMGNSDSVALGDPVVALGNALGRGGTPQETEGSVTALNQTITVRGDISAGETLHGLIQFNAPIQPGDSGGPLVGADLRIVGMDTAAAVSGGFRNQLAPSDAGFAIPINNALTIARQITGGRSSGNVHVGPRPLLGVEVGDAGAGGGTGGGRFGGGVQTAPVSSGAAVLNVDAGTPADRAGLAAGDVIVTLGGRTITDSASLSAAILSHKVGDTVGVTWLDQSGSRHSASVTFIAGPPA